MGFSTLIHSAPLSLTDKSEIAHRVWLIARRDDRLRVNHFRFFWQEVNSGAMGGQRGRTASERLPTFSCIQA